MSNIKGLGDLTKKDEKDKKKSNEYYTGGNDARGGGSGLAVMDPPDPADDVFAKLTALAKKTTLELGGGGGGGGTAAGSAAGAAGSEGGVSIEIYSNGFKWGSDAFRDLADPANQAMLTELEQGHIPRVLLPSGHDPRNPLNCRLTDKRPEKYEPPPPPPYIAFSGAGNATGTVVSESAYIFTSVEMASLPTVVCDESRPSTLIQVKQTSGPKKLRIKINLDAKVIDLAKQVGELSDGQPFVLSAGFPPVDIGDASQSIEQAGLKGASIILKTI